MSKTTNAPIAAIYYGTCTALADALKVNAERIDWAHWLCHKPERVQPRVQLKRATNKAPDAKPHIHLLIQLKGRVSTDLVQAILPPDPDGRSLTALAPDAICRSISDWLLYCTHRHDYIVDAKGLPAKSELYTWDDFQSTDYDTLQAQANAAEDYLDKLLAKLRRRHAVQDLAADLERPWKDVLRACRSPSEETVAWHYREAEAYSARLKRYQPDKLTQPDLLRDPSDEDPTEP